MARAVSIAIAAGIFVAMSIIAACASTDGLYIS